MAKDRMLKGQNVLDRGGPASLLFEQAQLQPDKLAIQFGDESWSNHRLANAVAAVAGSFKTRGLQTGDRVVLHLPNRPETIIALHACYLTGMVACPIRIQWTEAELGPLLDRIKPAFYIGCQNTVVNVEVYLRMALPADRCIVVDGSGPWQTWENVFTSGWLARSSSEIDMDAPALLISTSGTTGEPKLSAHSLRTLSCGAQLLSRGKLNETDHSLLSQSLGHSSGAFIYVNALAAGSSCELMDRPSPAAILDRVEQARITAIVVLPSMFGDLVKEQRAQPRDVGSVRLCLTAGDTTPLGVQASVRDLFGVCLQSTWATTEAIGAFDPGLRDGPLCQPHTETEVMLTDEVGHKVAKGQAGELRLRGPNLFLGYWESPERIDEARDRDGWFQTGDVMREEEDGQYAFVSRIKDLIIRGGTNISPVEVERVLVSHPSVTDAAVFGVPDRSLGQRVQALVVVRQDTTPDVAGEVKRFAAERLAGYKVPEVIRTVPIIPKNALGKVDRARALQNWIKWSAPCE